MRPALERLLGQSVKVEAASRTDAGVHAHGQVCAFDVERAGMAPEEIAQFKYSLNQLLPCELSVRHAASVPLTFDPRTNGGKEYRYAVSIGAGARDPLRRLYEWQVPSRRGAPLADVEAAAAAARVLEGTHAFTAFANKRRGSERRKEVDPVCTLSRVALQQLSPTRLQVRLVGSRFLYKMARNSVGAIVRVGSGELRLDEVRHALRHGEFERSRSVPLTAPAHGLVLHSVMFPPEDDPFTARVEEEAGYGDDLL